MEYRINLRLLLIPLVFIFYIVFPSMLPAQSQATLPSHVIEQFGDPPMVPEGQLSPAFQFAARVAFIDGVTLGVWDKNQEQALLAIGKSGDPRLAWIISDMFRFVTLPQAQTALTRAASELLDKNFDGQNAWHDITNHLLAWDIPAPPDYLAYKSAIFSSGIPGWEKLFVEGDIDWRLVSWGGVLIDNRAWDTTDAACNCIPAIDNPAVSNVEEASWLKDDDIVFGIEVNGISRPVLRTSGLLSRSNKVMYDLNTHSIFDTFQGHAITGPLRDKDITLKQTSVITTNWGSWKRAHPDSTVLLEGYALGRNPDFRNKRDANGPIFPIGDVDPRLPVHEDVIGAITASGTPVAFQRSAAFVVLSKGEEIVFENIQLELTAGGIRAIDKNTSAESETETGSHQAFWFAWSQFHPDTKLWTP